MSEEYKTVDEALAFIQQNLKAPKSRYNKFGKYNYRAQEDILEAVKPLLRNATLKIQDDMEAILDRVYLKAVVTLSLNGQSITAHAYAREAMAQSGMADAQITGSTSSYARKYALNGLFLIDDTQDADATNDHGKATEKQAPLNPMEKTGNKDFDKAVKNAIAEMQTITDEVSLIHFADTKIKGAKAAGATSDQIAMLEYQKESCLALLNDSGR
jgi:hypothetical protein